MCKVLYYPINFSEANQVMTDGVKAYAGRFVPLTDSEEDAKEYLRVCGVKKILTLRVTLDGELEKNLIPTPEYGESYGCNSFVYEGDLPASVLEPARLWEENER